MHRTTEFRPTRQARACWVSLLAIVPVLASASGCGVAAMALYAIRGNNAPAEFNQLEEHRVVVVCRPTASLQYANATVSKHLAREVAQRLGNNVRKIELVDPAEVEKWTDEHDWQEFPEVGRAHKADFVVAIDLESFSLYQGQTIFQGKADTRIVVYDLTHPGSAPAFEKILPQSVYPATNGLPTSDLPESEFRREFVGHLADQVGRLFYPHDAYADLVGSTRF